MEVRTTGAQIVLANTYHLMLRPGAELIEEAGGLHAFMRWFGPILTDSGGFQIFSLARQANVTEEGVIFRSHVDGSLQRLSPEMAIDLQARFGSEIMMPLDHPVGLPSSLNTVTDATRRTHRWLRRCIDALKTSERPNRGVLFGICQGGMDPGLRRESALEIASADVRGSAIGGLSVGESKQVMSEILDIATEFLPKAKPRYLMGVGSPEDLWNAVGFGVDLFDCVLPTRVARNGSVYTPDGRLDLLNARYARRFEPIDSACDCATCREFDLAYLHHLFRARELLALRLASIHNLRFLAKLMSTIRSAISAGTFLKEKNAFKARYREVGAKKAG
jgi:queuine tRNA-ribosyltransferase